MLKQSKFNIFIPLKSGEFLIYNTMSKSQVIVDEEGQNTIHNISSLKNPGKSDLSAFMELKTLGILVDDEVDEDRELEYCFQKLKFDTSEISATILTTFACNLRCTYCVQDGIASRQAMDKKTCQSVIAWICNKMDSVRPDRLNITFFGGEPLLNIEAVELICKTLAMAAWSRKVKMRAYIITNGVLLDPKMVEELKEWGLDGIKITLDGDETTHNLKRPARNGKGTYRTIINNMKEIKGMVPLSINGNFDEKNMNKLPRLLDELIKEGFTGKEIVNINFKPIIPNTEAKTESNGICEPCTFSSLNPDDYLYLWSEILKRGFNPGDGVVLGPCEALRENAFTVDPAGKIYKCGAFVGNDEFMIGNLSSGEMNFRNTEFMTIDPWRDQCRQCAYFPICGGGCRSNAQMESGDFRKISCEKIYFNNTASRLLELETAT